MNSHPDRPPSWPDRLGPYLLIERLGSGAMGVVYRGEHQPSGEPVAIKVVRMRHESHLSSIRREIHTLEKARHPGVVRILDHGLHQGLPWYAMELLSGPSLKDYLDALWRGAAPRQAAGGRLTEVLTLLHRLCEPLAYLHGEGIVHRDLKPDNVSLRPDGTPVLMDFGLVERFAGASGRESLELATDYAGTLVYMAPEQLRGLAVDARADLYAVGCLLYELLAGQKPFAGDNHQVIMARKLAGEQPSPAELVDGLPPALCELVTRLLAVEPRERLGYAEDVMAALAALGTPAGPRPLAPAPPRAYVYRPALSGRETALGDLEQDLRAASRSRGTCVLISGESGIGKTYLAMEVARRGALRGLHGVSGTCMPTLKGDGGPLHPFAPLLQTIADFCLGPGRQAADRLLGSRGKVLAFCVPALGKLAGQEAYPDPPELPVEAARERLFHALADTIAAFVEERPLLLLLDDLQWADELTLGFLGWLPPAYFSARKLLLLGTYRADEPTAALRRLSARPGVKHVPIGPLDGRAVRTLVGDMLAMTAPPLPFVSFLSRRSAGNPFFVAELLRTAVAEGLLSRSQKGIWQVGDRVFSPPDGLRAVPTPPLGMAALPEEAELPYESLPLPRTLEELIGQRLGRLPPASRALIEAAAVLGTEFDGELVLGVAARDQGQGQGEPERLEALSDLLARQMIDQPQPGRYRFVHEMLREQAYEKLAADLRPALHRAAGLLIEQRPDHPAYYPVLAEHFTLAGAHDQAFLYQEKAGEQALGASAHAQAARCFGRALELDDQHHLARTPLHRARLLRLCGEAAFAVHNIGVACEHLQRALDLLGHSPPRSRTGALLSFLWQLGTQVVHRLLPAEWLEVAQQQQEPLLEASAAVQTLIKVYLLSSERIRLVAMALLAANLKDRADARTPKGSEYALLGVLSGFAGLTCLARRYFARAHRSTRSTGAAQDRVALALLESTYLVARAEWAAAMASAEAGLGPCLESGNRYLAGSIRITQMAVILTMTGEVHRAIDILTEAQVEARAQGYTLHLAWAQKLTGRCLLILGRFDEALGLLEQACASLGTLADVVTLSSSHAVMALACLGTGDLRRARKEADRAQLLSGHGSANSFWDIDTHFSVPAVYLTCWEEALATSAADVTRIARQALAACAAAERHARIFPIGRPAALRHRGWASWLQGHKRRAISAWVRGAELASELHMPFEEGLTRYELGRRGHAGLPRQDEHLDRARQLFARLGCAVYITRIDELRAARP